MFACNTNVQLGESGHLYYASLYTTKDTQKEDSERFRRIGTQVITRIMRERYLAAENARLENREPDVRGPDFGEGLSMLLSGMNANMNKAICSATMAHLLINSKDGQRFEFSHEFTNILVGQMEDVLEGKEGYFRIRTNRSKSKEIVRWPDSSVDDYIHRPDELEDISLYEFNARFHKVCKTFKEMNTAKVELLNLVSSEAMEDSETGNGESDDDNGNDSDDNDGDDDGIEVSKTTNYKFQQSHPGFEFSHLKERKNPSMPVISLPKDDGLCPIKDLQIFTDDPSEPIQKSRERYAKLSLLMFYPFRELNDLKGNDGTFWCKFKSILTHLSTVDDATTAPDWIDIDSPTFYKYGIDILHNIDERNALHTMKRATEPLLRRTCYKENENEEESSAINRDDSDNDSGARDFTQYESNEADADASGLLGEISQQFERSSNSIIERGDVSREFMIGARINNQDSLLVEEEDATQAPATPVPTNSTPIYSQSAGTQNNFSQVIQLFLGTLVGSNSETYNEYVQSAQANDSQSNAASVNSNTDNGVFQNGGEQVAVPTLKSVALQVAKEEGIIMDEMQYIAYEIITSSVLLCLIEDAGATTTALLNIVDENRQSQIKEHLEALGGLHQLIMFLTGFAGAGKSTCITVAMRYCYEFCRVADIPWSEVTFLFTSTTGSSASLFGGNTIHSEAFLNGKESNIKNELRDRWKQVKLLIIDEISFFTMESLCKLDRRLKNILGVFDKPYGGMSIVFSGDFHQLKPVINSSMDKVLYDAATCGFFLSTINRAIILEESHRFDEDPEYGAVMRRIWQGNLTEDDIDYINQRLVGTNGVELPTVEKDDDLTYACPYNKQRNSVTNGIFERHLQSGDFPDVASEDLPPQHTIIIEADLQSNNTSGNGGGTTRIRPLVREKILQNCGDADVVVGNSKRIDPCLKVFKGSHVMVNNNDMLKKHKIGNGTTAR